MEWTFLLQTIPYLLIAFIICIVLLGIQNYIKTAFNKTKDNTPQDYKLKYSSRKHLMTQRELEFYKKKKSELKNPDLVIFTKVRLADIIQPKTSNKSEYSSLFNKISRKHIDFVICKESTGEILECIELNDSTHHNHKRSTRDQFVYKALADAGVNFTTTW